MTYRTSRRQADAAFRSRVVDHGAIVEPVDRDRIIRRDDSTCYMCHRKLGKRDIHLDHVRPVTRGGSHTEDNIKVSCRPCNLRKGNRLPEECPWLRPSDGTLVIKRS